MIDFVMWGRVAACGGLATRLERRLSQYGWVFLAALAPLTLLVYGQSVRTAPLFNDVSKRSGVTFIHQSSATSHKYLIESMSGGAAMLDYDGDGWLDLFFVNGAALSDPMKPGEQSDKSSPRYWNRLYRNNGDGSFTDMTEKAGLKGYGFGMGVAAADYDNDGRTDLYVTNLNGNILYHNNGDGTFTDVTEAAGIRGGGWSAGAIFVDYDKDGLLDLAVSRYLEWDFSMDIYCGLRRPGGRMYCHPDQFHPVSHLLFHNEGHGRFKDVSGASGIAAHKGKGLGVAIEDFDRDGWPDLLVANDSMPQQLFHNKGNGTFEEVGMETGMAYDSDGNTFAGMGAEFADYDNDGWPDIFVNALGTQRYALFRNLKGVFDYVSDSTGVGAASMLHSGWGTKFVDFYNDGWKDLFVAQGHVMDNVELTQPNLRYREAPLLLRNRKGKFTDVTAETGAALRSEMSARGVAFGDLNNDGSIDMAINVNNGPAVIIENRGGSGNHWLTIDTIGTISNRDGIGTAVRVETESGPVLYAMASAGSSYLSSNDKRAHFGLGVSREAKLVELRWPSGRVQRLEHVAADRILHVREP
jgi:enediyne biosynthesis protein E4